MWDFIAERREQIAYNTFQHANLVIQAVVVATVIAVLLAVVITRLPRLEGLANALSAIGLTIPSFALYQGAPHEDVTRAPSPRTADGAACFRRRSPRRG